MSESPALVYENTIHETLGIRTIEVSPERVVLELDVGPTVHQPMGLLHGGASAVIAESAASMGAYMSVDTEKQFAVGIDLNISHLRAMRSGTLRAIAVPIRKGRAVQVWGIDLQDGAGKMIAVARCTLAVRSWNDLKE